MKTNFLDSPIGKILFWKSLPMFWGIFAHIAYNLVDTFFVGKLGTEELAAMSFSFPIVMIVVNIMMGVGTAVNSLVSRAVGEKNFDLARKASLNGLLFTFVVSMLITFLGILFMSPLFTLLGVDRQLMTHVKDYMLPWYLGSVLMNMTSVGGAIFRAKGNVFYPSCILIFGAVLNALLDPVLIFGWGPIPALGIQGAALTTVLGNFLSAALLFYKLYREEKIFFVSIFRCFSKTLHKKIFWIAFPTALANSFVPVSTAYTNWMLISYGNAAVAANSIATRIETVPFIAIFALAFVLAPFIGQNWGAKQFQRIKEGIKKSFIFSYILGAACAVLFVWERKAMGAIFDKNPDVVEITSLYFAWVPFTYGILGTVFLSAYAMNAIGRSFIGNFLSAARLVIIYIPLAYFLNISLEIEGIIIARVIANTFVGILTSFLIFKTFFKFQEKSSGAFSSEPKVSI